MYVGDSPRPSHIEDILASGKWRHADDRPASDSSNKVISIIPIGYMVRSTEAEQVPYRPACSDAVYRKDGTISA